MAKAVGDSVIFAPVDVSLLPLVVNTFSVIKICYQNILVGSIDKIKIMNAVKLATILSQS